MKKVSNTADTAPKLPSSVPAPLYVRSVGSLMVLSCFLLPLKWGTLAVMSEAAGFFPEYISDYLTITWPAHSFGIWSGILLILTLFLPGMTTVKGKFSLMIGLWSIGLLAAILPGYFNSGADPDFASAELANMAGIAAWALAAGNMCRISEQWGKWMSAAFLTGVFITAASGLHQYFYGFAEMQEFMNQQIADGIVVPEAIKVKLTDTRINGFMASSNSLSGLLLFSLPLVFYFGSRWGRRFEPANISIRLFQICGVVLLGSALILCRSRSVILCLIIAGITAAFSAPFIKFRFKIAAAVLASLIVIAGIGFALKYGRGIASAGERADYLRTSAVLVWENPLNGAGWGGFFYRHMQIKLSDINEAARDPHNMVAAFAGQSGIISGLIVLAALLLPLIMLWKERFSGSWQCAVFWSGLLFTLHALMDCDMHIPALMAGVIVLYSSALVLNAVEGKSADRLAFIFTALLIAAVSIWCNIHILRGEYHLAQFTEFLNPSTADARSKFAGLSMEKFENNAAKHRPDLALIPELAGEWFLAHGNLILAEERFNRAMQLNPRRPGIYRRLARLACMKGDFKQGRALLNKAQERFPKSKRYSPDYPENRAMLNGDFSIKSRISE